MPSLSPFLTRAMAETVGRIDDAISGLLPESTLPEARLLTAMRYGCTGSAKRLRGFLVVESARLFAVNSYCALRVAAAVEFVHCAMLVHDDLPILDASESRRGRPTTHIAFDEATALLAGDALLAAAFELLTEAETHEDARIRINLVAGLAKACGQRGIAGGQMLDLLARRTSFDIGAVTRVQRLKAGELLAFSARAGGILGRASPPQLQALGAYAHDLGLALQIADDILDAQGREQQEPSRADTTPDRQAQSTFVSVLGAERARDQANRLAAQAITHLDVFEGRAGSLRMLAEHAVR